MSSKASHSQGRRTTSPPETTKDLLRQIRIPSARRFMVAAAASATRALDGSSSEPIRATHPSIHPSKGNIHVKAVWEIPIEECPTWDFGEDATAAGFGCLDEMINYCRPAAFAFVNYMANMKNDHRSRGKAWNLRTELLVVRPSPESLTSALHSVRMMSTTSKPEDFTSALLTLVGLRYQMLVFGDKSPRQSPRELLAEALKVADEFNQMGHPRREAYARFIATDILSLFLRDFPAAKIERVKADAMLGVALQAKKVVDLGQSFLDAAISGNQVVAVQAVHASGNIAGHAFEANCGPLDSGQLG